METKKFKVSLTEYPKEFHIVAKTEAEAIEKAKNIVSFSVYESKAEVVEEFTKKVEGHKW
jgi:hypothetical protein